MRDRIPQGDQERKDAPMYRGLLGYFPAALFEVAAHSLDGDRKHNPGAADGPTWARGKSADHEDTIIRHLIDAGPRRPFTEHVRTCVAGPAPKGSSAKDARRYHLRCAAWRALALLQEDCEADGAEPGVSSVFPAQPVIPPGAVFIPPPSTPIIQTTVFPPRDRFAGLDNKFAGLAGGQDAEEET